MSADALSEQWLIDVVTAAVPVPSSPEGPGDDAALVRFPPAGAVVTTDALVEGVHFLRAHPAEALGWKALAVNLSDVAAMGARPTAFLLTAGVPDDLPGVGRAALGDREGVGSGDVVDEEDLLVGDAHPWPDGDGELGQRGRERPAVGVDDADGERGRGRARGRSAADHAGVGVEREPGRE